MEEKFDFDSLNMRKLDYQEPSFWKIRSAYLMKNNDPEKKEYKKSLREFNNIIKLININFLSKLDLYKPIIDLNNYPKYSLFVQFRFTLNRPFYSNDDDNFYVIENPITKEHVFKIPMMRASSWKGNFRNTTLKINDYKKYPDSDEIIQRLFGYANQNEEIQRRSSPQLPHHGSEILDTNQNEDDQKRGRLIFYPTYFDKIGLEVIAPHSRETKTVKTPIFYEVVPKGGSGFFSLLYLPFDLLGSENPKKIDEVKRDYEVISLAIKEMMTTYGFGAKTSSGYGVVEEKIEDCIVINNSTLSSSFVQLSKIIEGCLC